jgi:hypothetical protein
MDALLPGSEVNLQHRLLVLRCHLHLHDAGVLRNILVLARFAVKQGKGSHPRQKRWGDFVSEAILHGLNHPGEHVPLLPPTGFHYSQQPLDKSAPRCRLRTERQLPPNHRLTQSLRSGGTGIG